MSFLETLGIGRVVVIGSDRFGNAPVSHGKLRIEFRRMLERTCRLIVIECVNEAQALIEEFLSFRIVSGNRMMQISQSGDQRCGMGLSLSMLGMVLRACAA